MEATSLVKSVNRQSKRTPRRSPQPPRCLNDLLEDDEEDITKAEALASQRWPLRPTRIRIRKPKPLARDISGIERQVLMLAKIHLFAYALVEGVYQTRATYLLWAAAVHHATWQMELPGRDYQKPGSEILEIMVNNIATMRGKVKERLREFVSRVAGFKQNMLKEQEILRNIKRFNELYPNSFHCKTSNPRKGDFEHPEIGHAIAMAIFHGPNAVGVLYSDYFQDMPLTVVAFVLAMWQFCLEEWAKGWRQNGDLGMASMREKYEGLLARLKKLRQIAPKRVNRLQDEWRDFAAEYSGAVFNPDPLDGESEDRECDMRPDTPEPDAISAEEMEEILVNNARQESIEEFMRQEAARELNSGMDIDEDESRTPSPLPRSPTTTSLPAEYNEHGVQTSRSKGKGRAN